MKLSCETIQDMLPLVVEDLASEDTVKLVQEHIENCEECKQEYEEMKKDKRELIDEERIQVIPLEKIKKKLKNKNIYIGILSILSVSLILLIGIDKITKPIPLTFDEAIESTRDEGTQVFIEFTPEVSNYDIVSQGDHYDIKAWQTNIHKVFGGNEPKNTVIQIDEETNGAIHYINQNGAVDQQIYGPDYNGGQVTLPRLAMNYSVYFMGMILFVFFVLYLLFKKKDNVRKVISPILIFSLSYLVANLLISGIGGSTYHILRDTSFVLIATVFIFSLSLLLIYKDYFINQR